MLGEFLVFVVGGGHVEDGAAGGHGFFEAAGGGRKRCFLRVPRRRWGWVRCVALPFWDFSRVLVGLRVQSSPGIGYFEGFCRWLLCELYQLTL